MRDFDVEPTGLGSSSVRPNCNRLMPAPEDPRLADLLVLSQDVGVLRSSPGRVSKVSAFAKTVVGLVVLLVILVVALLLEGATHNAIAAWVAVGSLLAVLVARWLLLAR